MPSECTQPTAPNPLFKLEKTFSFSSNSTGLCNDEKKIAFAQLFIILEAHH